MTIQELYDWAVENGCEDYCLCVKYFDVAQGCEEENYVEEDNLKKEEKWGDLCIDFT